jgi:hypothetical protein
MARAANLARVGVTPTDAEARGPDAVLRRVQGQARAHALPPAATHGLGRLELLKRLARAVVGHQSFEPGRSPHNVAAVRYMPLARQAVRTAA